MWTRNDNFADVTRQEADQYCKSYNFAGLSGWELPTIDELAKLDDPHNSTTYNIRKPFRLTGDWVWSSTKEGSGSARNFYFNSGRRSVVPMDFSFNSRALCVRRSGK
jgi:Protein of unknown function (DUF1566)